MTTIDPTTAFSSEFLSPNVRVAKPSATLAINELSASLEKKGKNVVRFGFGQSPFPVPENVVASLRTHAACKDYLEVRGLAALRQSIADYHRRVDGLDVSSDDVVVGPGSKELMFLVQLSLN